MPHSGDKMELEELLLGLCSLIQTCVLDKHHLNKLAGLWWFGARVWVFAFCKEKWVHQDPRGWHFSKPRTGAQMLSSCSPQMVSNTECGLQGPGIRARGSDPACAIGCDTTTNAGSKPTVSALRKSHEPGLSPPSVNKSSNGRACSAHVGV